MDYTEYFICGTIFFLVILSGFVSLIDWSFYPLNLALGISVSLALFFWIFRNQVMAKIFIWTLTILFVASSIKYPVLAYFGTKTTATINEIRTTTQLKILNLYQVKYTFPEKNGFHEDMKVMWTIFWPPCLFAQASGDFPVLYLPQFSYLNEHSGYCEFNRVNTLSCFLFSVIGMYLSMIFYRCFLWKEE
ncbi:MAG: hypothetical protein WA705_19120 [Candidatus Ozemobacteraceae bacterium]